MNNIMKKKVFIIVAHADDETLAMGGTIAKHVSQGSKVFVMSMTDGVSARELGNINDDIENRADSANKAAKILGFQWVGSYQFPDNALDTVPMLELVKVIEENKNKILPDIIYTHSQADLNVDHRIVNQAVFTAFRPQPNETWEEIRSFEIPSSTDYSHPSVTSQFTPNLYINIENTWNSKLMALKQYHLEMRPDPHSRSYEGLEGLAKLRGFQVGIKMAEAFEIIRKIDR